MPIYEYKCNSCGEEFEELVGSDAVIVPCPKCRSTSAERLFSVAAVSVSSSRPSGCVPSECPRGGT
ncbi:MAG: zinc ribbon domain-containing protein [candidate division Zixibacteria bacterium]|nr:zinc ribbon domain-containing protein [candidate division Zixibacteria bacterium]MDH3937662.1 zinc ribbon domain-containing protein [candidate division Zixibacteria bacterium]MDH4034220.1 zinc ribbon domain-containing protein [candidate division Zixibacteria bacterium]